VLTVPAAVSTGANASLVAGVSHSSIMYFIDPKGRERFLASPLADYTAGGSSYSPLASARPGGAGHRAGRTPARPLAAVHPGPARVVPGRGPQDG
jgi:hypothetical protein